MKKARERRIWWHWQNLNDKPHGRTGWPFRHGRAWFHFFKWSFQVEWSLLRPRCGVTMTLDGNDEYPVAASFAVPMVCIYLAASSPFLRRITPQKSGRQFGVRIHSWSFWWSFWERRHDWRCDDPWWTRWSVNIPDLLLGKVRQDKREIVRVQAVVPMPERSYPCTVTILERSRWRTRWPFRSRWTYGEVEIPDGIPVPGKGENSWDCGDDATYGLYRPAKDVPDAIAGVVENCLRTRLKRQGRMGWETQKA